MPLSAEFRAARDAFDSVSPERLVGAQEALARLMPPCPGCEHWKPDVHVHVGARVTVSSGITACQAEKMYKDFSCYTPPKHHSGIKSSDA